MNDYYLVYKVEAENEKQAQAITADLYERNGIEPEGIFRRHEWDIRKLLEGLKKPEE
jgi:hypothetical protein